MKCEKNAIHAQPAHHRSADRGLYVASTFLAMKPAPIAEHITQVSTGRVHAVYRARSIEPSNNCGMMRTRSTSAMCNGTIAIHHIIDLFAWPSLVKPTLAITSSVA